jgi:hypothetical protein
MEIFITYVNAILFRWCDAICNLPSDFAIIIIVIIIIIIIIIIISCHRFPFFPGTSALEPVVNPTTQASSLSL